MSKKVEQFIRKLNSTELNIGSTNDAYVRISKEIHSNIPDNFFLSLDSKKVPVLDKNHKTNVEGWVRYQHYPSNNEYRVVSLSSIFKGYNASPGDYLFIEKITANNSFHYEIYMNNYEKICLKFKSSKNGFEILNLQEVKANLLLNNQINIYFEGTTFNSAIKFLKSDKKREDSPEVTEYYEIENLPDFFYEKLNKDSFVELVKRGEKFYLSIENSWTFNTYID